MSPRRGRPLQKKGTATTSKKAVQAAKTKAEELRKSKPESGRLTTVEEKDDNMDVAAENRPETPAVPTDVPECSTSTGMRDASSPDAPLSSAQCPGFFKFAKTSH